MKKDQNIYGDFEEWPDSWMMESRDKEYGERICVEMKPFIEALIEKGLTKKTIKRHIDYLWLLGGEIIREVNMYREYKKDPRQKILEMIDENGGPLCHDVSESESVAFDGTCRKFWKFLSR